MIMSIRRSRLKIWTLKPWEEERGLLRCRLKRHGAGTVACLSTYDLKTRMGKLPRGSGVQEMLSCSRCFCRASPRNAACLTQRRRKLLVSKAFKKCVELVEEMLREGYRLQISSTHVDRLIKIHIGADKRTVQKYMKLLTEDLGFLQTVTKNPSGIFIYRIDIETTEQYVSEHMKEKPEQFKLPDLRLREEECG